MLFDIGKFIESLRTLVPDLSEEQVAQISSILALAFGEPEAAAEIPGATPEMMAYFGLGEGIDIKLAVDRLDEVLAAIREIVPLDEDQLVKVSAILQLSLATAAADEEEATEEYEEEVAGETMANDEEEEDEEEDEEKEIRTIVAEVMRELRGPRRAKKRVSTRSLTGVPPYAFTKRNATGGDDANDDPRRAAMLLRFGKPDPAIKSITTSLYGRDYDFLRDQQAGAFKTYLRWGAAALGRDGMKALKRVLLAPSQIKAYVTSGMSVASMKTDMSEVIDELGGFTVPEDFRLDMIERLPGNTVVRRYAEVLQTGSDMMTRVKVTGGNSRYTGNVRVTWVGDVPAAGDADTNATYSLSRAPIHICMATIHVPVSLLEDTPFPLVQYVNQQVSEAYAIDEDEQFLIGTGIAKPEGILPNSGNLNTRLAELCSGSASTVTADGLKTLKYGVKRQYRGNAIWIMNDQTAMACSKLKDGEGRYLWEDSMQADEPDRLLGNPVETSEAMPDIAAAAYPIIYGDLKQGYQIADRIGMSVIRDEITGAETGMVKFVFRRRLGGQVRLEVAMAVQDIAAT